MPKTKKGHFLYTAEGKRYLLEHYDRDNESAYVIADALNTYYNQVYRALRYHGIARKTKAEAQRLGLEKGTASHPTKGKERTFETKEKIGREMHNYWAEMPEEKLRERVDKAKELWYDISKEDHDKWRKQSHKALRKASVEGSKFEKFLLSALIANKYKVQPHKKLVLEGSDMNVDVFLPVEGICIEIDGPSHTLPIWGDEALEKTIQRDLLKNELLLSNGYTLIRISNIRGYSSKTAMTLFTNKFLPKLKEISKADKNGLYEIVMEELIKS